MNSLIKQFGKNFTKLFITTMSMVLLMVPIVWLQLHSPHALHSLAHIFSQYSVFFILFRCLLITGDIIFWPKIVRYFANKQQWPGEYRDFWLRQRFHIAGWLIVFELLVCENLLLRLMNIV